MPLTSKLRADYVELINNQLDTIKFDSLEDFVLVEQALQNIIQPMENYSQPEKYREKMSFIEEYLQSPEDYVEHESNYSEYQQIIRERINAKILELQSLDMTQKQFYIQHQQTLRSQIQANQQTMAERRPPEPNSDSHVISEEQWHAEEQNRLNLEEDTNNRALERVQWHNIRNPDEIDLEARQRLAENLRSLIQNSLSQDVNQPQQTNNLLQMIIENMRRTVESQDNSQNNMRDGSIENSISNTQNQTNIRQRIEQIRNSIFGSNDTQNSTDMDEEPQRPRR